MKFILSFIFALIITSQVVAGGVLFMAGGVDSGEAACTLISGQSCVSLDSTQRIFRTNSIKVAQMITTTATRTICKTTIHAYRASGTRSTTIRCGMFTESAGEPNTQVGGWSDTVVWDSITTDSAGETVEFPWSSNKPSLSTTTNYFMVWEISDSGDDNFWWRFSADTDDTCSFSDNLTYDGASWNESTTFILNFGLYSE